MSPRSPGTTPSPDAAAQRRKGNGTELPLDGLEAGREPGTQVLPYTQGAPSLLRNIAGPPGATQVTLQGPGAHYQGTVDTVPSPGNTPRAP